MKIKKWWFYFTLVAAMVIATMITNLLYINGLDKVVIFSVASIFIGFEAMMLCSGFRGKITALIFFLLIFCSSSFLIMVKPNEFAVFYRDGRAPVVLESYPKLAIPYTYDITVFNRHQKLIITDNNKKAVVDFELPKDSVLMVQHGFADQKDFADKIQAQAYPKFFKMNSVERKAYLDSFYNSYGLRWEKVAIEINIDNIERR